MTIGVGFRCSNGLVVCADREITGGGGFKYEESKITTLEMENLSIVYTYAGDPDASKMMFDKAKEALWRELNGSEFDDLEGMSQQILERVFRDRQTKGLSTIWEILAFSQHFLIKTKETKVVKGFPAEQIGFGDSSVLRYVCDFLLPSGHLNASEARILGGYIVSVASRYVQFCGGDTDTAVLFSTGQLVRSTGGPWPNQKQRYEYCEQEIGAALRELLFSGGTRGVRVNRL